jgi:hypothetical protein
MYDRETGITLAYLLCRDMDELFFFSSFLLLTLYYEHLSLCCWVSEALSSRPLISDRLSNVYT